MNEINGFTFYKNYYEFYKNLSAEEKVELTDTIFQYMFDGEENEDLSGMVKAIWMNIKMPLDTSKKNIKNGQKGGRKKTETGTQKETETGTQIESETGTQIESECKPKKKPKTQANNISIFLFLFSNLYISNLDNKEYIYKLFSEYLELRIKSKYTLTETVVRRLIKKLNEYGKDDEQKIEIITNAINGRWKDFYSLNKEELAKQKVNIPSWFNKDVEKEQGSEEEIEKMRIEMEKFKWVMFILTWKNINTVFQKS